MGFIFVNCADSQNNMKFGAGTRQRTAHANGPSPYSHRVGLIEWVENTKPLKDFLQDALTDTERKHYGYVCSSLRIVSIYIRGCNCCISCCFSVMVPSGITSG